MASNDATILADADHATYCVVGPSQTTIGGEPIAWDYSEAGVMTASSRNDLKEVSEDLYDDLKSVKLSSLYILKDVVVGAERDQVRADQAVRAQAADEKRGEQQPERARARDR